MSVLEPVQQAAATSAVTEQHEVPTVYVPPPRTEQTVVDHLTSHSMKCYWDFVECRWQCSGD